jgi:aminopeptidase N
VHEFYHNINGSQVTGDTPFEIWLNEAVTVHVQREREDVIFGHDYMRLGHVIYARMPGTGPLALDRAPSSMAVEPAGFNTTMELISAMTYSKAPEFVRMTALLIGEKNFVRALKNYYDK